LSAPDPTGPLESLPEDYVDLYENAPCGYLSLDPNGRIVKSNATLSKWLGFSAAELAEKRLLDLLNIAGRIFFETHFAPLLRMQGYFNEVALELVTQTGARLPVLINATERRNADGGRLFTRLTIFNATDRRRYERDLVEARARAEAAEKKVQASLPDEQETAALREQFIAVLGHDLRNPLAAISSGASLLKRMPLDERGHKIAGLMQESANRMAALIDNVMDFARGRLGGGLSLDLTPDATVEVMLEQVIAELRASAPDRVINAHYTLEAPVTLDPHRMAQLFSNLLGNALTHGTPGEPIRVTVASGQGEFTLTVANASEPIPAAAMERLFQPFFRGADRPSRQGLGLGLYIASEIARAHGGAIAVTSDKTETAFTFRMSPQATEQP
jgi:sigma-B regulation protein RsbU (phosphoserine phosphatase)